MPEGMHSESIAKECFLTQIDRCTPVNFGALLRSAYEQGRSRPSFLGEAGLIMSRRVLNPISEVPGHSCHWGAHRRAVDHLLIVGLQVPTPFWDCRREIECVSRIQITSYCPRPSKGFARHCLPAAWQQTNSACICSSFRISQNQHRQRHDRQYSSGALVSFRGFCLRSNAPHRYGLSTATRDTRVISSWGRRVHDQALDAAVGARVSRCLSIVIFTVERANPAPSQASTSLT